MPDEFVTLNAAQFELDGWTLQSAAGTSIPRSQLEGEDVDVDRTVRAKLLEHFSDTFITTYEPEIVHPTVDGMEPDSWQSLQEVLDSDEYDEDLERHGVDGPIIEGEGQQ